MMAGTMRTTISLCVIVMELTQNTQFLLPIMLAVMCAKWVGDALSRSIYEELMELKSITFLGHHAPHWSHYMTCVEVCNNQDDVKCVNEVESVERLIQLLQTTTHNAFPVVCSSLDNPKLTKTYRGLILRKNLVMLLSMKMFKRDATEGEGPQVIRYEEYVMLTNRKWPLQNAKLPPRDDRQNWVLDVSAYVDRSSPVVMQSFAFSDAYRLFQTLGLRHLSVLDDESQVVGILTRHDFIGKEYTFNSYRPLRLA